MKVKLNESDKGFTLVELMTVMAIIGILAAAIMVSLKPHKKRAEGSAALTEMSAVMQNIYLCIADEGTVSSPSSGGGNNICSIGSAYGNWPTLSGPLQHYSYNGGNFAVQPWVYSLTNSTDGITICCNSTSGRCQKFEEVHTCTANELLK